MLSIQQQVYKTPVHIHFKLIENMNDSIHGVKKVVECVQQTGLQAEMHLDRFTCMDHGRKTVRESPRILEIENIIKNV